MGAMSAVQVVDEALLGADLSLTAEVLAANFQRVGFVITAAWITRPLVLAPIARLFGTVSGR